MISTDKKILNYQNAARKIARHKKQGQKIVLVTGCFDIIHLGHLLFFNDAKKCGDILVIGIGSDQTIKQLKGQSRPVMNERLRSRLLAAFTVIDYVIINKEPCLNYNIDHSILMSKIKPDIYVVPSTDKKLADKKALAAKYGGRLKTCRRLPPNHLKGGISSTQLLDKIKQL